MRSTRFFKVFFKGTKAFTTIVLTSLGLLFMSTPLWVDGEGHGPAFFFWGGVIILALYWNVMWITKKDVV